MHIHHPTRKRFGQHFLHDGLIIQRIIDAIHPLSTDHIVEIGPGQGAITLPILKKVGKLDAIELDRDLITPLKIRCDHQGFLNIYQADALGFDFHSLQKNHEPLRIIGNLPYNISTPLIFHLLCFTSIIKDMHFMLQKEVVDRLTAAPGSHAYGRLSIMIQYHCETHALFDVPPSAFYPPPEVNSSIVRLIPRTTLDYPANDYDHFSMLVKKAFAHRRKTLRNNLKDTLEDIDWEFLKMDSSLRPERLSIEDFIKISNYLTRKK